MKSEIASSPLDVVIPLFNGQRTIISCLSSLQPLAQTTVTVVDNASTDESRARIADQFPSFRLVHSAINTGFARACNQGIQQACAPAVLVVNQDTVIDVTGIQTLLAFLHDQPRCAAVGGRIENPDGTLQPSMGPSPHPLRVLLDRVPGIRSLLPTHVYRHPRFYASPREPAWLTGACILLRRAALEDVGLFDEAYFMYTEDLDWCTRARKRGWTVQYLPVRTAVHRDEGRRPDRAPAKARWMREGLLRYFERHGTPAQAIIFRSMLRLERIFKNVILNEVKDLDSSRSTGILRRGSG